MKPQYDVLIAGSGPAGAALAISLHDLLPHLSIAMADPGRDRPFRIGESVPPPVKPFLDQLGLGNLFRHDGHEPAYRTYSAWGGSELIGNEFLQYVHNTGWRLDRVRFDNMMRQEALRRGTVPVDAAISGLKYEQGNWRVDCGSSGILDAGFVVDATGRSSALTRLLGCKPTKHDSLLAAAVFFEQRENPERLGADGAVVESCRDGWWYTVPLPERRRVVMLMTDTDLARRMAVSDYSSWRNHLLETSHIQALLGAAKSLSSPRFWSAATRYYDTSGQQDMLAVGDALSCFDPLSSQGIVKALRSAIFASYAIADRFLRDDASGIERYHRLSADEFASYLDVRRDYYRQ